MTDRASLDAAAARVEEELGGADVLVNNAGQMLLAPFEADRAEETRRMVEVNLLGAMNATAAFLPQLRRAGGDIVNVSSLAGRSADRTSSVYSATKWGMIGWSEVLRQELAPAVRVLLVEPGLVETELSSHIGDEASRAALQKAQDADRLARPRRRRRRDRLRGRPPARGRALGDRRPADLAAVGARGAGRRYFTGAVISSTRPGKRLSRSSRRRLIRRWVPAARLRVRPASRSSFMW